MKNAARPRLAPPPTPTLQKASLGPASIHIGDLAVHPSHGVGEVTAIEQRDIGGVRAEFYVLRILPGDAQGASSGIKVMVATNAVAQVGLRAVMSGREADRVLETMRAREVAVDLQPWSRRFRAYTEMLKSGAPHEIAKVMRDMARLKFDKELSFGERRLLDQARSLLMTELSLAKKMALADLKAKVDEILSA
jgi:CarD family transcriptional regulator